MNINEKSIQMAKIAVNKSILKEFTKDNERVVYLNDGDEFQINLFNSKNYTIAASISIDGNKLEGQLVLRPGERVWLERYLDKSSKFKFSTYEVEANNDVVKNAIRDNGKIVINFYKEKTYDSYTWPYAVINKYRDNRDPFTGEMRLTTAINSISSNNNTYCSSNIDMLNLESFDSNNTVKCCASLSNNTIETGRVEEGSYSEQKFKNVNKNFETWAFQTEAIKIIPISQKQYNSNDLKKIYCSNCGRKLNSKFKFCPYCGEKVI